MSQQLNSLLKTLTKKEIIAAVGPENLNRAEKRKRCDLVASVQQSTVTHSRIISAAQDKAGQIDNLPCSTTTRLETALNQLTVKEIVATLHESKLPAKKHPSTIGLFSRQY